MHRFIFSLSYLVGCILFCTITPAQSQGSTSQPNPTSSPQKVDNGRFSIYVNQDTTPYEDQTPFRKESAAFEKELFVAPKKDLPYVYSNHVKSSTFMGNPVLINLGNGASETPKNADDISALKDTLSALVESKEKLLELNPTSSDAQRLIDLANDHLKSAVLNKRPNTNGSPNKYLLVFNYNIPALKRGWPLSHNYSAVMMTAHIWVREALETAGLRERPVAKVFTTPTKSSNLKEILKSAKWSVDEVKESLGVTPNEKALNTIVDLNSPRYRSTPVFETVKQVLESSVPSKEPTPEAVIDKTVIGPVNTISIYPTSQILTANLVNTRSLALSGSGGYAGANASVTYTTATEETYSKTLPKLVGQADPYGHVQWICYPAKSQQIAFGNRSGFVVFTMPQERKTQDANAKSKKLELILDARLTYKLKGLDSLGGEITRVERLTMPLENAMSDPDQISMFLRTTGRTLPVEDEIQLQRLVFDKDPASLLKSSDSKKSEDK